MGVGEGKKEGWGRVVVGFPSFDCETKERSCRPPNSAADEGVNDSQRKFAARRGDGISERGRDDLKECGSGRQRTSSVTRHVGPLCSGVSSLYCSQANTQTTPAMCAASPPFCACVRCAHVGQAHCHRGLHMAEGHVQRRCCRTVRAEPKRRESSRRYRRLRWLPDHSLTPEPAAVIASCPPWPLDRRRRRRRRHAPPPQQLLPTPSPLLPQPAASRSAPVPLHDAICRHFSCLAAMSLDGGARGWWTSTPTSLPGASRPSMSAASSCRPCARIRYRNSTPSSSARPMTASRSSPLQKTCPTHCTSLAGRPRPSPDVLPAAVLFELLVRRGSVQDVPAAEVADTNPPLM